MAILERLLCKRNVIILFCLVFTLSIPQILKLETDKDYIDLLPYGNQGAKDYDKYLSIFPSDVGSVVVVNGNNVCTSDAWTNHRRLTQNLENLNGVDRVIALTTSKYVVGKGDTVSVKKFIDSSNTGDDALCGLSLNYKPYKGLLINGDASALAFYVVAEHGADSMLLSDQIGEVIDNNRHEYGKHDIEIFQSGEIYASSGLSRATDTSSVLLPIVVLVMLLVARYLTKSWKPAVLVAATGMFGALFTFSLMGLTGVQQNPVNVLVINLFIPLGAAFAIHAHGYVKRGGKFLFGWLPKEALRPFGFAAATTMIGFGSTAISGIPAVQQFGLLGVFGIAICLFVTFTLTFPVLSSINYSGSRERVSENEILRERSILSAPKVTLLIAVLAVFSVLGYRMLRVNYGPIDYLKKSNQVRINFEKTRELFGTYFVPLVIFGEDANTAIEPDFQLRVHEFAQKQKKIFPGMQTSDFYDQLSEVSMAFSAQKEIPESFPSTREGVSQFMLFFEEKDTEPYIDFDRKSATVIFQTPFKDSSSFNMLDENVMEFRRKTGLNAALVGRVAQFFRAGEMIATDNLRSLVIGIFLVLVCLAILLKSIKLAFLAIIPNVLPVMGSLSLLGLFGIDLDIGSSIVSAVALGLVVDDTGHMVAKYSHYRKLGLPSERSASLAVFELKGPIVMTTVTIVIGFLIMNMADLIPFHTFSRLLSVTMIYALFGDLVILPALLARFDRPWLSESVKGKLTEAKEKIFPPWRDVF